MGKETNFQRKRRLEKEKKNRQLKKQHELQSQDIFEVIEKLPTVLPRSPDSAGLIVITESLENLDITREFTISRDNVSNAIEWLKANNPLYIDVHNDTQNAKLDVEDFLRVHPPPPPAPPLPSRLQINEFLTIIRANWNQGNAMFGEKAGKQCCAMAIGAIVRSTMLSLPEWDSNTLNEVLIESHGLYELVYELSDPRTIPDSGYLLVNNFDVAKNEIKMFGSRFSLQYDQDPTIFGSLDDRKNQGIVVNLAEGLQLLFMEHKAGILISNSKSYAVMKSNDLYYFADSHSCGPKGAEVRKGDGRACVIECSTFNEFIRKCKRATGSKNIAYTLDYIEVTINNDIISQVPYRDPMIDDDGQISHISLASNSNIEDVICPNPYQLPVDSIPVQTTVMASIDAHHPQEESVLAGVKDDGNQSNLLQISRKTTNNIVNDKHELKAEEFAWYYLFPKGVNGLKESRPVKISPLDYFQSRVMGKDTRFQRTDYLFYALSMYEYYRIQSNINVCGKKIQLNNEMVEDVHLYVKNLRGSMAYWNTALSELLVQIRCLGPPHYFLTFSSNDLHWEDMILALLQADGTPDKYPKDISIYDAQKLVEKYPVVVSRHFIVRVNAIMSLLNSDETILGGKSNDHWWLIEFQNRGSPHLHMLVWIEGTPSFDTPEGIARIDEVMTCELPDDPELKALVSGIQRHGHTDTCYKNNSKECRFNYPRILSERTHIVSNTSDEFIKNGGRTCILKRKRGEEFINNYNIKLLKHTKANMDIQACESNESIATYLAKYAAKNEPTEMSVSLREAIRKIRQQESNTSVKLFKICMKILHERQVSACECAFRLCHLPLKQSSRRCVFINTRKPDQRYNVFRFANYHAAGYCKDIIERYVQRPLDPYPGYLFEQMSLMEFAMLFEPYYSKAIVDDEDDGDQDAYEDAPVVRQLRLINLLDGTTKMKIRNRPAVARVPSFREASDPDNYYYSLLAQYCPFRDENELLRRLDGSTYDSTKEAFLAREAELRSASAYMDIHRIRDRQLDNAINRANAFIQLEDPTIDDDIDDNNEDENDIRPTDDEFRASLAKMNVGQRDLFNFIAQSINNQLKGSSERVKMHITGGAGTGKTFTLNLIKEQIRLCYDGEKGFG